MNADDTDPIAAAAARYKRADDAAKKARETLTDLVVDALRQPDAKPADIARRADWTSAYVRKLARDNGIQADPAYKARTEKARATLLAQAQTEQPDDSDIAPAVPGWLTAFPQIAALSFDQARQRAQQLELDRPQWFIENRKVCTAAPEWVNHAMLAADANDPAPPAS